MAPRAARKCVDKSDTHACTNTHNTLCNMQWFCNTHQTPPTCLLSVHVRLSPSWQTADIRKDVLGCWPSSVQCSCSKIPTRLLNPIPFTNPLDHATSYCIPRHACPHIKGHTAPLAYHTQYKTCVVLHVSVKLHKCFFWEPNLNDLCFIWIYVDIILSAPPIQCL